MTCKYCGKTISDDSVFCGYCGKSLTEEETRACSEEEKKETALCVCTEDKPEEKKRVNGLAIAGFCASSVNPIAGLIMSIIALAISKKRPICKGFAVAGIICNIATILAIVIYLIVYLGILTCIILAATNGEINGDFIQDVMNNYNVVV